MEAEYKIKLPLITDEELLEIDRNWQYLVDEYMMMTLKEKDQLIAQYVMQKQKEEIERLNNIINSFEEELEREINIKEEDLKIEHNTYMDIKSTLEKVLKRLKELKGEDKEC